MSEGILVIALLEVLGLAVLFATSRVLRRRREQGKPRLPRPIRIVYGLFALAVLVGGPGVTVWSIYDRVNGWEGRREELMARGTPAIATITNIEETGTVLNHRPEVRVSLNVEPETGMRFSSQETWPFSIADTQNYRIGTRVQIYYDPSDTASVAVAGVVTNVP